MSAIGDLDRSTQQNAAMAEKCTAAAASLAREAERLRAGFAGFRTDGTSGGAGLVTMDVRRSLAA